MDVQRNLKSYSPKKLMSLANVLIDVYYSEQIKDDLVVVVVDLKETIENLKRERNALEEKIASIEHERDDLIVVVVDLKETIECASKEKETLTERVAIIEQEKNNLVVVVVDLKEIIEEFKTVYRFGKSEKGKEVASEAHIKLENELNLVKISLCVELEKNKQLQEELGKTSSPKALGKKHFEKDHLTLRDDKTQLRTWFFIIGYGSHSQSFENNLVMSKKQASFSALDNTVVKSARVSSSEIQQGEQGSLVQEPSTLSMAEKLSEELVTSHEDTEISRTSGDYEEGVITEEYAGRSEPHGEETEEEGAIVPFE
ncbi:kinesin-like protein KIN-14D [Nicotiana sylvestris]|uniref:kinesin-like protein KIN-14D n=1 Tax=Nicotiana sylvestris TaxID=4096 RepID=UPI00388C9850